MEIFKPIPGYEKLYEASTFGRIRSIRRNIILKPSYNKGYPQVAFQYNKIIKSFRVHTLVAITFLSNPNNYETVNHIDGVKSNNNLSNLEWCSLRKNMDHAMRIGLIKSGEMRSISKLSYSDVNDIRNKYSHLTCDSVATLFNVCKSTISRVRRGHTWK